MTVNITIQEPIYTSTSFRALNIGDTFILDELATPKRFDHVKVTARKAQRRDERGALIGDTFILDAGTRVGVLDRDQMNRVADFMAKPLFDGSEASCKSTSDYHALYNALYEVVKATEELDNVCAWVMDKIDQVRGRIRREGAQELERPDRFSPKFAITPRDAAKSTGLNSCGELQGNGNIDMAVAKLIAKREAFNAVVNALGYRVSETLSRF